MGDSRGGCGECGDKRFINAFGDGDTGGKGTGTGTGAGTGPLDELKPGPENGGCNDVGPNWDLWI